MVRRVEPRSLAEWIAWAAAAAALTVGMTAVRSALDGAHVALAYLLLVLAASARRGRALGFAMAAAGFLCFNFFFLPPYSTFVVHDPLDWFVLVAFLATSAVATQLLHRLRAQAEVAARRADEIVRLAAAAEHAEALREADRLKDSLLMSVSHDLRTPLTTIRALGQDMAADGDERAVVVVEEADRLNRFVSDLLDLSRINAGELAVKLELVAAEDVLGAALQRVSGVAGGREVSACIDVSEPILVARLDFVHALRALVNLIENALKYSPPERPVEVSLRRDGDRVAFLVADRGAGIPASLRERVFEPFVRGDRTADAGGTGLGLAIARRLAEAQGGTVSYAEREGGGSVFTLALPAASAAELRAMSL